MCRFSPENAPHVLADTHDNAPAGVLSQACADVYSNAPQVKIRKKARSSKGCADKSCSGKTSTDTTCPDQSCPDNSTDKLSPISSEVAMHKARQKSKINCPKCGKHNFTDIRKFNLMFKTFQGVTEDSTSTVYLRPETAQGIFVNFKNVQRTSRKKVPFGIAQIGKSFRNEITPGNFTFRTREFEQMELEFFCKPGEDLKWHSYWKNTCKDFLLSLNMTEENIRLRDHEQAELSHYSNATTDIEYRFPFGFGELWGIADRTDYDLKCHQNVSKQDMEYIDQETNERYIPYCIEPSVGCDRVALAFLCDAYTEEEVSEGDVRTVLKLHPFLAPIKATVLPLSKKLDEKATEVYTKLASKFNCEYDNAGSIGKRYRRQDEIGTPFCVTVDFETETDGCVTVRNRDTMTQERIKIEELESYIEEKIKF